MKVFDVREVQPTYRLALLTALAFMLAAPLPLLLHLGHPLRSYEMLLAPNLASAMAVFGFVYVWYLMVVLLLEIWFDYRKDLVVWSQTTRAPRSWVYKLPSRCSPRTSARKPFEFDEKAVRTITIIGIPSAFLLHGYVGFIFGSIKANPWWSSVLMPIVFLFSAIVSGIALVISAVHDHHPGAWGGARHEVPRSDGVVSVLRRDRRLHARNARLHSPSVRERGVDQDSLRARHQPAVYQLARSCR